MLSVTRQGPSSYYCATLALLTGWLEQRGYRSIATHQNEAARLQLARSIIVIYYNGTVLLQGADLITPRQLLDSLLIDQAELPL